MKIGGAIALGLTRPCRPVEFGIFVVRQYHIDGGHVFLEMRDF